jgi:predicted aspartyl protease
VDPTPREGGRWQTSRLVPVAIVGLAIVLIGAIIVGARSELDQGGSALVRASVDATTLPVTVPYREVAGAIVIDVTFGEGSRTVPMILDTGAPTIITEDLAAVFALEPVGTLATTSVDGQVATSSIVPLPVLHVGGARFSDVGAVVRAIEPGDPFSCISDAGFIGSSLLRTAVWRIDPQKSEVTIAASLDQLPELDSSIRLGFEPSSSISPSPVVDLETGDGSLAFMVDTGSDGWIAANPDDLERAAIVVGDRAPTRSVLGSSATGQFATQIRWASANVDFGAGTAAMPLATSDALPPGQGDIGTDFLSHFILTIDWTDDTIYLEPIDPGSGPSIPMSVALGWDDGFMVGSYVDGLAEGAGLQLGAPVAAVDGRDVTSAPFDEFCAYLRARPEIQQIVVAGDALRTVDVEPVRDFYEPLAF